MSEPKNPDSSLLCVGTPWSLGLVSCTTAAHILQVVLTPTSLRRHSQLAPYIPLRSSFSIEFIESSSVIYNL